MNKLLKKIIIISITLGVLAFAASYFIKKETKKNSPQDVVEFVGDKLTLKIVYCQPYKKGRLIFGDEEDKALQPYGKYWRLGANEATTIETNQDLIIGGNKLKKGIYSIYAVPEKKVWKIAFNKDANRWGASEPNYDKDLFAVEVPVNYLSKSIEQFNIQINQQELIFSWDTSEARLPYQRDKTVPPTKK